jgi:hypothetical protein
MNEQQVDERLTYPDVNKVKRNDSQYGFSKAISF